MLSHSGAFALLLSAVLTIMVGAAVAPGLSSISIALGVSEYAPLLITLPALGAILLAPVFGQLIDRIGSRKTLLLSLLGYSALGTTGVFIDGPMWMVVNRVLLGGFAAGIMAATSAEISLWYQGNARLKMIAKQGMAVEFGGVVFLFIGGLLSEIQWQYPFLLYALGLVCAALVLCCIPASTIAPTDDASVTSDKVAPTIKRLLLTSFLAMGLFFSMIITLPGLLASLAYTAAQTGYLLSFISLVAVFAAMQMPRLVTLTGTSIALACGFTSYLVGFVLFADSSTTPVFILAALFAGTGFGLTIPLLNHEIVSASTSRNRGRNLAYFAMAVFAGQFATSAIEFIPAPHAVIFHLCAMVAGIVVTVVTLRHLTINKPLMQE